MINSFILLPLCFGFTSSAGSARGAFGGREAIIEYYPSVASIHKIGDEEFGLIACGVILSTRHILTAAHIFDALSSQYVNPRSYKVRVGSELAHSGGIVHGIKMIEFHYDFRKKSLENDLAIMGTLTAIQYVTNVVSAAFIVHGTYRLRDNETLWTVGWGVTEDGHQSEQFMEVKFLAVNPGICKRIYKGLRVIHDKLLCSGWYEEGGHDLCTRDSGAPLFHRGNVVGIASLVKMTNECGNAEFPGINVKVSSYSEWIAERTRTRKIAKRYEPDGYFINYYSTTTPVTIKQPWNYQSYPCPYLRNAVTRSQKPNLEGLYNELLLRQTPYFHSRVLPDLEEATGAKPPVATTKEGPPQ